MRPPHPAHTHQPVEEAEDPQNGYTSCWPQCCSLTLWCAMITAQGVLGILLVVFMLIPDRNSCCVSGADASCDFSRLDMDAIGWSDGFPSVCVITPVQMAKACPSHPSVATKSLVSNCTMDFGMVCEDDGNIHDEAYAATGGLSIVLAAVGAVMWFVVLIYRICVSHGDPSGAEPTYWAVPLWAAVAAIYDFAVFGSIWAHADDMHHPHSRPAMHNGTRLAFEPAASGEMCSVASMPATVISWVNLTAARNTATVLLSFGIVFALVALIYALTALQRLMVVHEGRVHAMCRVVSFNPRRGIVTVGFLIFALIMFIVGGSLERDARVNGQSNMCCVPDACDATRLTSKPLVAADGFCDLTPAQAAEMGCPAAAGTAYERYCGIANYSTCRGTVVTEVGRAAGGMVMMVGGAAVVVGLAYLLIVRSFGGMIGVLFTFATIAFVSMIINAVYVTSVEDSKDGLTIEIARRCEGEYEDDGDHHQCNEWKYATYRGAAQCPFLGSHATRLTWVVAGHASEDLARAGAILSAFAALAVAALFLTGLFAQCFRNSCHCCVDFVQRWRAYNEWVEELDPVPPLPRRSGDDDAVVEGQVVMAEVRPPPHDVAPVPPPSYNHQPPYGQQGQPQYQPQHYHPSQPQHDERDPQQQQPAYPPPSYAPRQGNGLYTTGYTDASPPPPAHNPAYTPSSGADTHAPVKTVQCPRRYQQRAPSTRGERHLPPPLRLDMSR